MWDDQKVRDALAANGEARHVVRGVDGKEQHEREQIDAQKNERAVNKAPDDIKHHGAEASVGAAR